MLVDEQQPRSTWKLARVVQADAEIDNHVRKAKLKTAEKKTLWRDRESLVLLEMDCEYNNDVQNDDD